LQHYEGDSGALASLPRRTLGILTSSRMATRSLVEEVRKLEADHEYSRG
jgi:hypothetical protein